MSDCNHSIHTKGVCANCGKMVCHIIATLTKERDTLTARVADLEGRNSILDVGLHNMVIDRDRYRTALEEAKEGDHISECHRGYHLICGKCIATDVLGGNDDNNKEYSD